MFAEHKTYVQTWLNHIQHLAGEIGPRGSTTPQERLAADYCRSVFNRLGYDSRIESFVSARSIYQPHLLAAIFMIAAFVIYPFAGRISAAAAAFISLFTLGSDLLELGFRDNFLRRLIRKGNSQNALAVVNPSREPRQDLVLIGHIDSHRSPLIFRSKKWVDAYKAFTTVAFVLFALQGILYGVGIFLQAAWIWPVTILSAIGALLLAALCLEADSTPFSAGANDNASAAGLLLTLAEYFRKESLQSTRVWLVCTGCEEVQHYGAIDFFHRHLGELRNPKAIAFEMLGCDGPAWLIKEGIIVPFHADANMVSLAEKLAAEHPEWKAYPSAINGGNTEMADAHRVGIPAITLSGMTREGDAPYWHQKEDTPDKMNPEVMERAYGFILEYIRTLDRLEPQFTGEIHLSAIPRFDSVGKDN